VLTSSRPPPLPAISSWRRPAGDRRGTWLKLPEQRLAGGVEMVVMRVGGGDRSIYSLIIVCVSACLCVINGGCGSS
jgi:hypothetical protein